MKTVLPFRAILAALALAGSVACSETAAEPQPAAAETADVEAQIAQMFIEGPSDKRDRPDFSNETVLKLNPIVARTKAALDRFDELAPELDAARQSGDKARVARLEAELGRLKTETETAHAAFQAEKKALIGRKEYYNEVVLAAMEQFVAEAPGEIAQTIKGN